MIAGFGLTKMLLARHRIGLCVTAAYLGAAVSVLLMFGEEGISANLAGLIFLGMIVAGFYLLAVFLHSDSDVATPGSTYPSRWFTLPVKTADLVLWPVLSGLLCMGGVSYLLGVALRASGFAFDSLLATLVVASLLTSMQAVFWFPIGIRYSKLVLAVLVATGIILITLSDVIWKTDHEVRAGMFLAVILGSIALTWIGVARARIGGSIVGEFSPRASVRLRESSEPFRTPFQAQTWYEWRQHGWILPLIVFVFYLLFLIPIIWEDTSSPLHFLGKGPDSTVLAVPTYLLVYYTLVVFLMVAFAWVVGFGMKRTDVWRNDGSLHLFFATRPLTDEALVGAKFKVAFMSALAAWGVLVLGSLPLLLSPAGNMAGDVLVGQAGTILSELPKYLTAGTVVRILSILGILFFLTWRNLVIGFWTELSGNLTLRYLQPLASTVIYATLSFIPPRWTDTLTWLFLTMVCLVVTKYLLSSWVAIGLVRKGVMSLKSVGIALATHLLILALVGIAVHYATAPMFAEVVGKNSQTDQIAATLPWLVLWYVPLTRVLLAVKVLSWNRHR